MHLRWMLPIFAFGSVIASLGAHAAGSDPLVIPGIGPEQMALAQAQPSAPAPRRMAAAQPSPLGGGFIELLMTGRDPSDAYVSAPAPSPQPVRPRSEPASYRAADPVMPSTVQRGLDPAFARQEIPYNGHYPAGTLVVDTPSRYLYLVQEGGRAIRYGIGVGRPGFSWAGEKRVTRKAEWPGWTPPPEMIKRRPDLPRHMDGGPANPLGARALYLGSSLYRIHGTNEPETIGHNVSSGCIRMMNEDVIDLYNRVPVGARVIVI